MEKLIPGRGHPSVDKFWLLNFVCFMWKLMILVSDSNFNFVKNFKSLHVVIWMLKTYVNCLLIAMCEF